MKHLVLGILTILAGLLLGTLVTAAMGSASTTPGCAVRHVANGTDSLDYWTRVHRHSVSEVITASLACHSYIWPQGLVRYIDAGFLHNPMPQGMVFYTVK